MSDNSSSVIALVNERCPDCGPLVGEYCAQGKVSGSNYRICISDNGTTFLMTIQGDTVDCPLVNQIQLLVQNGERIFELSTSTVPGFLTWDNQLRLWNDRDDDPVLTAPIYDVKRVTWITGNVFATIEDEMVRQVRLTHYDMDFKHAIIYKNVQCMVNNHHAVLIIDKQGRTFTCGSTHHGGFPVIDTPHAHQLIISNPSTVMCQASATSFLIIDSNITDTLAVGNIGGTKVIHHEFNCIRRMSQSLRKTIEECGVGRLYSTGRAWIGITKMFNEFTNAYDNYVYAFGDPISGGFVPMAVSECKSDPISKVISFNKGWFAMLFSDSKRLIVWGGINREVIFRESVTSIYRVTNSKIVKPMRRIQLGGTDVDGTKFEMVI